MSLSSGRSHHYFLKSGTYRSKKKGKSKNFPPTLGLKIHFRGSRIDTVDSVFLRFVVRPVYHIRVRV